MSDKVYEPEKPSFTEAQVDELCSKLYGISPSYIRQLQGYDDQNFWIKNVQSLGTNKHLNQVWPYGYVFKITNSKESENIGLIEAQIQICLHLEKYSVCAPIPVANVNGNYYSLEENEGDGGSRCHAVRLLIFRNGKVLNQVTVDENLSQDLGEYLYKLDESLKDFFHPAFKDRDFLFLLENVGKIKHFFHIIEDKDRLNLIKKCVQEFEELVIPKMNELEKGIIHGDYNEQNILISDSKVSAILDFGDCQYAPYIFELAIGLAYFIILTKDFDLAKLFLKGYTSRKGLTDLEKSILIVCIKARISQSLVLGLYAYSQNPSNHYVLCTQKSGWQVLQTLSEKGDYLLLPS